MERLPLRATVTEAAQRYGEQFPALLRVIALPALAYAVMSYLWYDAFSENRLTWILLLVAQGFPLTLAAISCHRVFLLGSESVPSLGASGTTARDWRFIGMATLLFVITNILLQVPVTITFLSVGLFKPGLVPPDYDTVQAIGRIVSLPAIYVACRFSICLPAIAVGRRLGMRQAWMLTRGYGWRLLLLIGVAPYLLRFTQHLLANVFPSNTDYTIVDGVLFWSFLPFEIALLSICYRRLSNDATVA